MIGASEYLYDMVTTPERIDSRDAYSRSFWSQTCPGYPAACEVTDAQGKTCPQCARELPGFIAAGVKCPACSSERFYCGPDSEQLPGKPDLRCFACDTPMAY